MDPLGFSKEQESISGRVNLKGTVWALSPASFLKVSGVPVSSFVISKIFKLLEYGFAEVDDVDMDFGSSFQ